MKPPMKLTNHNGILMPASEQEVVDRELRKIGKLGVDPIDYLFIAPFKGLSKKERKKACDEILAELKRREDRRRAKRN